MLTDENKQRELFLQWRDIKDPCKSCNGSGIILYGSTSTWHGGIGGAAMTRGVCDKCWGSGDKNNPGADLRKIGKEMDELKLQIRKLTPKV